MIRILLLRVVLRMPQQQAERALQLILAQERIQRLPYDGTNDEWDFNKNVNVTGTGKFSGNVGIGTTSPNNNLRSFWRKYTNY